MSPRPHLLRSTVQFADLSGLRAQLRPFYSETRWPSVDPCWSACWSSAARMIERVQDDFAIWPRKADRRYRLRLSQMLAWQVGEIASGRSCRAAALRFVWPRARVRAWRGRWDGDWTAFGCPSKMAPDRRDWVGDAGTSDVL